MRHVVHFSGGVTSWGAARRVVDRFGAADTVLLFADTLMEDQDVYRFVVEAGADVYGVALADVSGLAARALSLSEDPASRARELVDLRCDAMCVLPSLRWIADGRDPWQVFEGERYIGNTRADPCSRILKRELLDRWGRETGSPDDVHYVGLDWTEPHRVERFRDAMAARGVTVAAPMAEAPYVSKADLCANVRRRGFEPPRLYALGFPHANCGGFCVKAGHAQFRRLLEVFPDRYREHERREERLREALGKDVTVLRDRRGGKQLPLTMRAFRGRVEANESIDLFDWGGCGCAVDEAGA